MIETGCSRANALERNMARHELPQIEFPAGVINIDSRQVAFRVVVQNDPF